MTKLKTFEGSRVLDYQRTGQCNDCGKAVHRVLIELCADKRQWIPVEPWEYFGPVVRHQCAGAVSKPLTIAIRSE